MAALPSEYFFVFISQAHLAKVNFIHIINSESLVFLNSCIASEKLLTSLNLFPHPQNENKHKIIVWIQREDIHENAYLSAWHTSSTHKWHSYHCILCQLGFF